MPFVLFDTEYIADKGLLEEGFEGWKNREVIQVAAIKVDDNLEVIETFNFYVKPKKHESISEYFVKLTGITNEVVAKQGKDFSFVYGEFKKFAQDLVCYSHCWSEKRDDGDGEVMREMLADYGIKDENQPKYGNIAFWFKEQYQKRNIDIIKQSSGEIVSLLGLDNELKLLNLQPHNALYDVYSILVGLRYLGF